MGSKQIQELNKETESLWKRISGIEERLLSLETSLEKKFEDYVTKSNSAMEGKFLAMTAKVEAMMETWGYQRQQFRSEVPNVTSNPSGSASGSGGSMGMTSPVSNPIQFGHMNREWSLPNHAAKIDFPRCEDESSELEWIPAYFVELISADSTYDSISTTTEVSEVGVRSITSEVVQEDDDSMDGVNSESKAAGKPDVNEFIRTVIITSGEVSYTPLIHDCLFLLFNYSHKIFDRGRASALVISVVKRYLINGYRSSLSFRYSYASIFTTEDVSSTAWRVFSTMFQNRVRDREKKREFVTVCTSFVGESEDVFDLCNGCSWIHIACVIFHMDKRAYIWSMSVVLFMAEFWCLNSEFWYSSKLFMNATVGGERTVKELRLSKVLTIPEGTAVSYAGRRIVARRGDSVLLTDANILLLGIVTDKDIATRVIAEESRPEQTIVSKVMTRSPVSVASDSLAMEALQKMVQGKFRHLPVVKNGEVIALLDITKCLYDAIARMEKAAEQDSAIAAAVEEVERQWENDLSGIYAVIERLREQRFKLSLSTIITENTKVAMVSPSDLVYVAARKMRDLRVNSVIITTGNKPQGILTSKDVLIRVLAQNLFPELTLGEKGMTSDPECATLDTTILDALHIMHDGKFLHLPVVDKDGCVVAYIDLLQITHAEIPMVEGSSGAVNDRSTTMMRKLWDSALALDPPKDDYDTQSEMSAFMSSDGVEQKICYPSIGLGNSLAFKFEDRKGRVHRLNGGTKNGEELVSSVRQRIDIDNDRDPPQFLYEDDEGDKVLLETHSDLAGAISHARSTGLKVLKLHLEYSESPKTKKKQLQEKQLNTIASGTKTGFGTLQTGNFKDILQLFSGATQILWWFSLKLVLPLMLGIVNPGDNGGESSVPEFLWQFYKTRGMWVDRIFRSSSTSVRQVSLQLIQVYASLVSRAIFMTVLPYWSYFNLFVAVVVVCGNIVVITFRNLLRFWYFSTAIGRGGFGHVWLFTLLHRAPGSMSSVHLLFDRGKNMRLTFRDFSYNPWYYIKMNGVVWATIRARSGAKSTVLIVISKSPTNEYPVALWVMVLSDMDAEIFDERKMWVILLMGSFGEQEHRGSPSIVGQELNNILLIIFSTHLQRELLLYPWSWWNHIPIMLLYVVFSKGKFIVLIVCVWGAWTVSRVMRGFILASLVDSIWNYGTNQPGAGDTKDYRWASLLATEAETKDFPGGGFFQGVEVYTAVTEQLEWSCFHERRVHILDCRGVYGSDRNTSGSSKSCTNSHNIHLASRVPTRKGGRIECPTSTTLVRDSTPHIGGRNARHYTSLYAVSTWRDNNKATRGYKSSSGGFYQPVHAGELVLYVAGFTFDRGKLTSAVVSQQEDPSEFLDDSCMSVLWWCEIRTIWHRAILPAFSGVRLGGSNGTLQLISLNSFLEDKEVVKRGVMS